MVGVTSNQVVYRGFECEIPIEAGHIQLFSQDSLEERAMTKAEQARVLSAINAIVSPDISKTHGCGLWLEDASTARLEQRFDPIHGHLLR